MMPSMLLFALGVLTGLLPALVYRRRWLHERAETTFWFVRAMRFAHLVTEQSG